MDKLHFKGKLPKQPEHKVFGPDAFGGWYRPVSQRYDIYDDMTTIFFQPVPPKDLPAHMVAYSKRIAAQRKDPSEWLKEVVNAFCQDEKWSQSLQPSLTSLRSGAPAVRVERVDSATMRSQKELLKRFKKLH